MPTEPGPALTRKLEALWRKVDERSAWATARKALALLHDADPAHLELEALGYVDAIEETCRSAHGRLPETPHEAKPT
jgi:hypothetical protein